MNLDKNLIDNNMGFKEINESSINTNSEIPSGSKTIVKETNETLVKGFFTENIEVSADKNFLEYIEKIRTDANNKYSKYFVTFFDNFVRTHSPKKFANQLLYTLMVRTGVDLDKINRADGKGRIDITKEQYLSDVTKNEAMDNLINLVAENLDEISRANFLQDVEADRNSPNKASNFTKLFNESATYLNVNARNQRTATKYHGQNIEGNVNERNNAMYDYAVLLNNPSILAKSVPMTIIKDGKTIRGSYMLNVKGVLCQDLLPDNPELNGYELKMSADGMKSLSNMEILDFLCANTDRNSYNLAYQLRKDEQTHSVYIVGVQGIDNDASFGIINYKTGRERGNYMSKLDQLKWIDKSMAKYVLNIDEKKLTDKLMKNKVTYEEVKAAKERLHALQQKIRKKDIVILDGNQWDRALTVFPQIARTNDIYKNTMIELNLYKLPHNTTYKEQILDPDSIAKVSTTNEAFNLATTSADIKEFSKQIKDLQINSPEKKQLQIEMDILSKTLSKLAKSKEQKIEAEPINNINNINNLNNPQPNAPDYTISMLSDFQRNMLSDSFKHVIDAAKNLDKTVDNPKINFAIQSIIVKTNELALGMKQDAMEAEKNLLEKLALSVSKGENVEGKVKNISNSKDIRDYASFAKQTAFLTNKIAKYIAKEPQDSPLYGFMEKAKEYRSDLETALVTGDFSKTSKKYNEMLSSGLVIQAALNRKPIYKLTDKERELKLTIEAMDEFYKHSPKTNDRQIKATEVKTETFSKDKKEHFLSNLFTLAKALEEKKDSFIGIELNDSKEMKDIKSNLLNVLNLNKKSNVSMLEARLAVRNLEEAAKAYVANPKKAENARKSAVRDIAEYIDENIGYFGIDKSRAINNVDKKPIVKENNEQMLIH